jgi:hypothetical protein
MRETIKILKNKRIYTKENEKVYLNLNNKNELTMLKKELSSISKCIEIFLLLP